MKVRPLPRYSPHRLPATPAHGLTASWTAEYRLSLITRPGRELTLYERCPARHQHSRFCLILPHQFTKMTENKTSPSLFSRENYTWMLIGIVVIAIGIFLMSGGASKDPGTFNAEEVYSARRITVAPILILAGLVIEIYAIFKKPSK
jgi:hypothetical protein